jgi:rubrerythrin
MRVNAHHQLMNLLRAAHAGERAAAFAYRGHGRSVQAGGERDTIQRIEREEWAHRHRLGEMLLEQGQGLSGIREAVFYAIGRVLSLLCHCSGWFVPMYAAGWIEARNVQEYVTAAEIAQRAGLAGYAQELLQMAECEREHEAYFRAQVDGKWQARIIGLWSKPAPGAVVGIAGVRIPEAPNRQTIHT